MDALNRRQFLERVGQGSAVLGLGLSGCTWAANTGRANAKASAPIGLRGKSLMKNKPCAGSLKFDELCYSMGKFVSDTEVIHHDEKRADKGYTLICGGEHGHLYEVTERGDVVWEYIVPLSKTGIQQRVSGEKIITWNVRRYSPDYPGLSGKKLTPGKTIAGRSV